MTKNKKYEITFTKDIEVTFYDKNYNDNTRLIKAGEKITATFIADNNNNFKDFRCGKELFSIPTYTFDSIQVTPKKKVAMKQVTVVANIAITMEVPVDMDLDEVKRLTHFNTIWDCNTDHPNISLIEVSDIIGVDSITEAPIG